MENNIYSQKELVDNGSKRQKLAEQIFQEVQEGYYLSSSTFLKSLYIELNNSSDHAIEIMLRNKRTND